MYPLAHIGTALIIGSLFYVPLSAFVIGVLLPDILDKSLSFLGVESCGRSYGHSILFALAAGGIAFAVTRKKGIALAIALGCLLHLAGDSAGTVPYFYPMVDYGFGTCDKYAPNPGYFEVAMEVVGITMIILWWKWRSKLIYLRDRVIKARGLKRVFG
ncbi:MAG: metal-dependent hydrolase [Candidatus Aenigmarchaeota archaeon]|nr:metal-dependent hydrolase [Candidatus Aenigmarchaeota archaeon]